MGSKSRNIAKTTKYPQRQANRYSNSKQHHEWVHTYVHDVETGPGNTLGKFRHAVGGGVRSLFSFCDRFDLLVGSDGKKKSKSDVGVGKKRCRRHLRAFGWVSSSSDLIE